MQLGELKKLFRDQDIVLDPFNRSNTKNAAVIISLIEHADELTILFTQRTQHLEHHAGQICFPGGKQEDSDRDLAATALREVEEEIGIPAHQIDIIAQLPAEHSSSGFSVTPFLGILNPPYQFQPNTYEVADIFEIPFEHFMQQQNYYTKDIVVNKELRKVYFIEYGERCIWGLTARILFHLMQVIAHKK